MLAFSSSKLSALLAVLAALVIVVATFWQWWDITFDGGMPMRRWVRFVLVIVGLLLVASVVVLILSPD